MQTQVLVDGRKLGDGGIGVYIENLIDGILELRAMGAVDLGLSLLIAPKTDRFEACVQRWQGEVELLPERAAKYSLSEYLFLARHQREALSHADLFHSPHYTLPYFLEVPTVVTVHDAIQVTHPDRYLLRPVARRLIQSAVRRADRVLCVSHAAAEELPRVVGEFSTPIRVVPNAVQRGIGVIPRETVSQFLQSRSLSDDYCLFVGSDRPHKGFRELIEAWEELALDPTVHHLLPDLLIIGNRFGKGALEATRRSGVGDAVQFLGAVSEDELCLLYNGSQAVVVPSRIEGFGLPALEGLACGRPVVITPHRSLLETCGEAAWVSTEFGSSAIAEAVRMMLLNDEERERRVQLGLERAAQFSRRAVALATVRVYEEALGRPESIVRDSVDEEQLRARS